MLQDVFTIQPKTYTQCFNHFFSIYKHNFFYFIIFSSALSWFDYFNHSFLFDLLKIPTLLNDISGLKKWKDYLYLSEHKHFFESEGEAKTLSEEFVRYTLIIISNHTCRIFDLFFMPLCPAFFYLNPFTRVIISLHLLFSPFNLCKQTDSQRCHRVEAIKALKNFGAWKVSHVPLFRTINLTTRNIHF